MAGKAPRPGYDELARQIAALRGQVRALKEDVRRLRAENARLRGEAGVSPGAPPADAEEPRVGGRKAPPRWAKANVVRVSGRRPRRRRTSVPGRRREAPTRRIVHAPEQCPHCAAPLRRGRVIGRRQIIELPTAPAEVVEHEVLERRCPRCGERCRGEMPDLSPQAGAGRRVSWRVASLVAVLRTKLRLPLAQLQWLLAQGWAVRLSVGELSGLLAEAARAARPAYEALLAEARASPVVHVDETGWREDGQNGWIWTLTTPTVRLFRFSTSRAGEVARTLLGADYEGVVVSDFYTAYDQLDGLHQRCWAHPLRDIHELKEQHPADAGLHAWANDVQDLYEEAVTWAAAAGACPPVERDHARCRFEARLLARCRTEPAHAPHAGLCKRVERYHPELFTFVADPAVPPTNNAAERALRPLVVARKVSGGTRSKQGSRTRMILQSLVATWELRGPDPLAELAALLRAPRRLTPEIAPV